MKNQVLKPIPIWQQRNHTLEYLPNGPLSPLQLIYSDDSYEILSSFPPAPQVGSSWRVLVSPPVIPVAIQSPMSGLAGTTKSPLRNASIEKKSQFTPSSTRKERNTKHVAKFQDSGLVDQHKKPTKAVEQVPQGLSDHSLWERAVVFAKKQAKAVNYRFAIHACFMIDQVYNLIIVCENRYKVLKSTQPTVLQTLTLHMEAPQIPASTPNQSPSSTPSATSTPNPSLDTPLCPLVKHRCQYLLRSRQEIYVVGAQPIHPYEISSPLWRYSLVEEKWAEVVVRGRNNQEMLLGAGHGQPGTKWVFVVGRAVVTVERDHIVGRSLEHNTRNKQSTAKTPTVSGHPLLCPQTDSYIQCNFTSSQKNPSMLVLIKQKQIPKDPVLLQIQFIQLAEQRTTQPRSQSTSKIKNNLQVRSITEENRDDLMSIYLYIQSKKLGSGFVKITRLDLGVILTHKISQPPPMPSHILHNTSSVPKSVLSPKSADDGGQMHCLEIISEIASMQVVESVVPNAHHSITSAGTTTKKPFEQASKLVQKKVQTIVLSTASSCSVSGSSSAPYLTSFSIRLSLLQPVALLQTNTALHSYQTKTQYSDLIFLADNKQVPCNRQLFEFYSPKFKKLYSNSSNSKSDNPNVTYTKLEHTKLSAIYFLVKYMYYQFRLSFDGLDEEMLVDLMILAQKFQVAQMQVLCEQQVRIGVDNFSKLYDYFRNSETLQFREQFHKYFILHSQEIIKSMPIGKIEQLIRQIYTPECQHPSVSYIRTKTNRNFILQEEGQEVTDFKNSNLTPFFKEGEFRVRICAKCKKVLGCNQGESPGTRLPLEGSRNGSSRKFSASIGAKKKDNNSN